MLLYCKIYLFIHFQSILGLIFFYLIKNWSQHRKTEAKYLPKNIDPHLCTHLYFAFANIDTDNLKLATFERNDISDNSELPVNS